MNIQSPVSTETSAAKASGRISHPFFPYRLVVPEAGAPERLVPTDRSVSIAQAVASAVEPRVEETFAQRVDRIGFALRQICVGEQINYLVRHNAAPTPTPGQRGKTSDDYFGVQRKHSDDPSYLLLLNTVSAFARFHDFITKDVESGDLSETEYGLLLDALASAADVYSAGNVEAFK